MTDADMHAERPAMVAPATPRTTRAPAGEAQRCLSHWLTLYRRNAPAADREAALDGTLTPDPLTQERQ
jgi:hypothetical protein